VWSLQRYASILLRFFYMNSIFLVFFLCTSVGFPKPTWYVPPPKFQWQWQIDNPTAITILPADNYSNGTKTPVTLYDIDIDQAPGNAAAIKKTGAKVACYVEIGTWVQSRSWSSFFNKGKCTASQLGKQVCGDLGIYFLPVFPFF
jgi:hypothetical protein